MKSKKWLAFLLAGSMALTGTFADDFDDFGGDDFSFDDFGSSGGSSSSPVSIEGEVSGKARMYVDNDDADSVSDLEMDGGADATLTVKYSGNKADAEVKLNLDTQTLKDYPEDVVQEAFVTAYLGNFTFTAGKMTNVWGKGDKLHVIDNFNADDYTDFIIPDYLDRRIGTLMFKGSYAFNYSGNVLSNIKLEGIYTPFMPVDRFATSGAWKPAQVTKLTDAVTSRATASLAKTISALETARLEATEAKALQDLGTTEANAALSKIVTQAVSDEKIKVDAAKVTALMQTGMTQAQATNAVAASAYSEYVENNLTAANTAYTLALNNASSLSNDNSLIYPNTTAFEYGQAGARLTASLGAFDFGLSYYYGHYKQPSFNAVKLDSYLTKYLAGGSVGEDDKFLAYDKKQTFGFEFATILWHFNLRGEAAYNLTEDVDGDDPWVHNNSVQWLGGFDIDMPFWDMNINVQEYGTYVLKNDKIDGVYKTLDVDYNKNAYTNNKIVTNITTSFANDKIAPEVTVLYGIENGDFAIFPKLTVKPLGDISFAAQGMYIWTRDDDSEFAAWKNNSFVQISATVSF